MAQRGGAGKRRPGDVKPRTVTARRRRALGQNFLVNAGAIAAILERLDIGRGDPVVEIGPGRGALTDGLLRAGAVVHAVEMDRVLAAALPGTVAAPERLRVIAGDARRLDWNDLCAAVRRERPQRRVRVVGNLPYRSATVILQRFLDPRLPLRDLHLMFQREVADRIVAPTGASAYGFLAVLCSLRFRTRRLLRLAPGSFRPPPQVHSTLLRFEPRPPPWKNPDQLDRFRALLRAAFGSRRKTLENNLRRLGAAAATPVGAWREGAGLPADVRPQAVSPDGYRRLFGRLCRAGML